MLRPESWAVIATAAAGIIAALFAFLRTPPEQRMRVRLPSLEERLAATHPDSRAVIIRADRRRALRRDLPVLVACVPVAAFALWLSFTQGDACAGLFGVGRMRLLVGALFVVPPVFAALALLQGVRQSLAVFRGGHWPPLDTAVYTDTLAIAGRLARLRAIGLVVLSVAALATLAYGYAGAAQFFGGDKVRDRIAATEAACAARP